MCQGFLCLKKKKKEKHKNKQWRMNCIHFNKCLFVNIYFIYCLLIVVKVAVLTCHKFLSKVKLIKRQQFWIKQGFLS